MRNQITPRRYTRIYFLLVMPFAIIIEVAIMLGTAWYAGTNLADTLGPLLEWFVFSLVIGPIVHCVFYVGLFVIPPHRPDRNESRT